MAALATGQHFVTVNLNPVRGKILASDGFSLVDNKKTYKMFADIKLFDENIEEIAEKISDKLASDSAKTEYTKSLVQKMTIPGVSWAYLAKKIEGDWMTEIKSLKIRGIDFEETSSRYYPESSMLAHLLGFVGSNKDGLDVGYYGLEGYYNLELTGRPGALGEERDAYGAPILVGDTNSKPAVEGRTLVTTVDRGIQFLVEQKLKQGVEKYGAVSGTVTIMDPKTGAIIAMASHPKYDPENYSQFGGEFYSNPVISVSYEPGSTFKVLVMAAAINENIIDGNVVCDRCAGPRKIGEYTIKTWDDKYPPNPTMDDVIRQSNNVGMVFVGEKLGKKRMLDYLDMFGFGKLTGIDLQDESTPSLRAQNQWSEIDLATVSFGQGIAVTPIQMVRAVGAIANKGKLMRPYVVAEFIDERGKMLTKPESGRLILSEEAAKEITEMMVSAVDYGEAKWAKPFGYHIAGKTGTAQIPVAGHYDEKRTIASFVGFAPADEAKFVMLVTLNEPKTSSWGSETAAPLWFSISKDVINHFGIPPDK